MFVQTNTPITANIDADDGGYKTLKMERGISQVYVYAIKMRPMDRAVHRRIWESAGLITC